MASILMTRNSRRELLCKKGVLRNFGKFTGRHLCQSLVFKAEACNFIKTETLAQVLTVNFAKILRAPFLTEHLRWLLLNGAIQVSLPHCEYEMLRMFVVGFS